MVLERIKEKLERADVGLSGWLSEWNVAQDLRWCVERISEVEQELSNVNKAHHEMKTTYAKTLVEFEHEVERLHEVLRKIDKISRYCECGEIALEALSVECNSQ